VEAAARHRLFNTLLSVVVVVVAVILAVVQELAGIAQLQGLRLPRVLH
jgi:hypothetical protein